MSDTVNVFSEISNLDVSPQFNSYSKVIIHVNDNTVVEYGNDTGRTLEFDNPFGTQEMAQSILASLQASGYQYQPYDAQGTILNPAAEIGDALAATNVYGGIYTRSRSFGRLMKANVSAPHAEEINHEYQFETPEVREFKRETGRLSARLIIAENSIESQVETIDDINQEISTIKQTSSQISAEVLKRSGGSSSSFGWTLTDSKWTLQANGNDVFVADKSGVSVSGKITATSGKIGGFTISASAIYKGTSSLTSKSAGVYVGTNGIRVYGSNGSFTADNAGNVTLTGTLKIGSSTITANQLRSGAQSAYTYGDTWSTGAGYGYNYNNATAGYSANGPSWFRCGSLRADTIYFGTTTLYINSQGFVKASGYA